MGSDVTTSEIRNNISNPTSELGRVLKAYPEECFFEIFEDEPLKKICSVFCAVLKKKKLSHSLCEIFQKELCPFGPEIVKFDPRLEPLVAILSSPRNYTFKQASKLREGSLIRRVIYESICYQFDRGHLPTVHCPLYHPRPPLSTDDDWTQPGGWYDGPDGWTFGHRD